MYKKAFFLFCMVIIFYLTIHSLQKFNYSENTLNSMISQFLSNNIEDIKGIEILDKEKNISECPLGYYDLLDNFFWPGTFQGCGCLNEKNKYTYYSNICPKDDCINIEESKKRLLPNYDKFHFCILRGEKNYYDLLAEKKILPYNNISNCNNITHKICGFIDNLNNILCIEKNIECPITKFFYSSNSTEIEILKKLDLKGKITELNYSDNILFTSHSDNSIYLNNKIPNFFRIDMSQPCLNGERNPEKDLLFDLMNNKFIFSCNKYDNGSDIVDNLYKKISSYNYLEYLIDNNFYDIYEKIFKKFEIKVENLNLNLYIKTFPGWSFKCMKGDYDTFINFLKSPDVLNKISLSIIVHSFLVIAILIAIGICSFYFIDQFEKFFYFITLGFIVLNLIYPIQVISNANWIINNISDENGNYCGDDSLNILLKSISDSCSSLMDTYIIILILVIIDLIVFICILQTFIKPTIKEIQERLIQLRQYN